jgi:hypothetical protein
MLSDLRMHLDWADFAAVFLLYSAGIIRIGPSIGTEFQKPSGWAARLAQLGRWLTRLSEASNSYRAGGDAVRDSDAPGNT